MAEVNRRRCALKVAGCAGAAFLALSASVDNLVTYLFGPGYLWIVGGTFIAACWGYEALCHGFKVDDFFGKDEADD
ncbi:MULTISPECIES: hypothetical protein [Afifella]|uniref:Uncharacterized protein n=1 Tax=Afifella marina DSM 2698 TaxID=1120955 RepID=A0A1G5NYM7_AFIMA|nr:hypothetical protein [Afifella marina]SCZ41861.1 hypothetical protein SAMN03080610_02821 [Afifella marina DSM 2698]